MSGAVLGIIGTLAGTVLGWVLQFIKPRKIIFDRIEINPVVIDGRYLRAYFQLNICNTSDRIKAVRNPKIVCYNDKNEVIKESIQESKLFKDHKEKEEYEEYRHDIELLSIPAKGNISQMCMIDEYWKDVYIDKAYLVYKNERFKEKKIKIVWNNKEMKNNG